MRKSFASVTLAVAASLLGCGDLYRVTAHSTTEPNGIPFFVMKGVCVQETVNAVPYYLVTLKTSKGTSPLSSDSVKISSAGYKSADFVTLLGELDKQTPDFDSVQRAWTLLKTRQSFDPYTQNAGEFQLSNSSKVTSAVDYSQAYDINQKKPLSGTANAAFKIGQTGTLTEVSGQVEDTTLSTILSALPLSDLIKSAAGIAVKTGAAAAQPPEAVKFSLEEEERMKTTTYSKTYVMTSDNPNCQVGKALTNTDGVSMVLADIGAKDASAKPAAAKEENSIGLSGSISLPKALFPNPSPQNSSATSDGASGATGSTGAAGNDSSKKKPK